MGTIRPFVQDDIPQIADLYKKVFLHLDGPSSQALQSHFTNIFFHHPWCDAELPSLVYQENTGKIVGFLGVMPRLMTMQGQCIRVAVSNNFMVVPESRHTLAAVQLLKTFFQGPQDLSLAEGGEPSRRIWEGLGGKKALLYSLRWTHLLRPSRYLMSKLAENKRWAPLTLAAWPFCWMTDAVIARMSPNHFHQLQMQFEAEEADVATLRLCVYGISKNLSLRPVYDDHSLSWLLEILVQKKSFGTLRKIVLRDTTHQIVGWYLYYLNPGSVSEVLQIGANGEAMPQVLNHLFHDAWLHGAVALSGRLESQFIQEISEQYCFFHYGNPWMLIRSNNSELLNTIHRGEAFLSRLEGEWMFYKFFDAEKA